MIPFTASMLCTSSEHGQNPGRNLIIIDPWGARQITDGSGRLTIVIPEDLDSERTMSGPKIEKDISPCEWILLETLDCSETRPLHSGPFLTVQRRRRRRKYVRTYLFKDPTLIDDLSAYQTNFVLDRISNWAFNAFILDNVTGGRPLPNLCVHLFKSYGLLQHFNLDPVIVWKLFSIIEDGYHWRNPYHNAIHAADVTQAMHCFLQEPWILERLQPLEIFSAIVAAVTHDLDHPGVNQPFLVATSNHLVALYKNSSVLENHHWRSAMGCLNESGVSEILGRERVAEVEEQIKSLVLATDITRQQEFLTRLKTYIDTDTLDMSDPAIRHFILQIALKCADICNPCRPWDVSKKWSLKVCEEFFRQGDYERQLSLPLTPICDRYGTSVPKIQTGFLKFVVRPLFEEWHRMMKTSLSTVMIENLNKNDIKWSQLLEAEQQQALQDSLAAEEMEAEELEANKNNMTIETSDSTNFKTMTPLGRSREASESDRESRSVRFEPTIITAASDSDEGSEGDDLLLFHPPSKPTREVRGLANEFLSIPRPDGRRHSIATGLMGDNMQIPAQLLQMASGLSSGSGSLLSISDMVSGETSTGRLVGRTTIRRESLPAGPGARGGTLSSKAILHLQKISSSRSGDLGGSSTSIASPVGEGGDYGDMIPPSPNRIFAEKSSCSSASTTDEILDFTFSLPEGGGRSSGSPRRLTETTDFDELCPGTSILSMSNRVAHITLQQGADLEDQRRHLIRQQTCPVVSVNADGSFNRPRFLSAAAAISPTAVASSSIISQHRQRNRSPESGESGTEVPSSSALLTSARGSRGSSNEALKCEVISEEADRPSGSESSTEASPLEIFVQQFPPVDDNDGGAPRRGSGSLDPSDLSGPLLSQSNNIRCSTGSLSNIDPSSFSSPDGNSDAKQLPFDGSILTSSSSDDYWKGVHEFPMGRLEEDRSGDDESQVHRKSNLSVSCQSGFGRVDSEDERKIKSSGMNIPTTTTSQYKTPSEDEVTFREPEGGLLEIDPKAFHQNLKSTTAPVKIGSQSNLSQFKSQFPSSTITTTRTVISVSTQTDSCLEKENMDPGNIPGSDQSLGSLHLQGTGNNVSEVSMTTVTATTSNSSGTLPGGTNITTSNGNRLATILMWRNNRLWKSLSEEHDDNPVASLDFHPDDDDHHHHHPHHHCGVLHQQLSEYFERWDLRQSQGIGGGRLQVRRGSAPTASPALGNRGALDRRSDPTQYHSSSCVSSSFNFGSLFGSLALSETPSSAAGFAFGLGNPTTGINKQPQLRRCSVPVEMLRQTALRTNTSTTNKKASLNTRPARRGSLPTDPSATSGEAQYAYKWMHVFPYSEDDSLAGMKRRSSGGPELFAAAAQNRLPSASATTGAWKAQFMIDNFGPPDGVPTFRRGSLPVDVYRMAASGSCSSESESSAGDGSDT